MPENRPCEVNDAKDIVRRRRVASRHPTRVSRNDPAGSRDAPAH